MILRKKYLLSIIILAVMCTSCASTKTPKNEDILSQKVSEEGKIPLTISLKYSVFLDEFEKIAEAKFPNLDLIQVGNYTANYSDEYAEQLANNDLTDIVITWPLDKSAQNCEERLIDLSGEEFTSRYNLSMLNNISQNGKLYYLPGPTQLRGILFNKTMFEENGWEVPTNFDEFIELCKTIEASGMRSLQLSFWNKEVLQYAFIGFGYSDSFSTPALAQKQSEYLRGKGSLSDFALPAFDSFIQLKEAGIFKASDLEIRYPIREAMFFNRECAMVSEGIALIAKARAAGNSDEFAVMPFYSEGERNAWGHLIPLQFIGLNKELKDKGNEEKYELAMQVMDFISSPEGQLALANNDTTIISSLSNSQAPSAAELIYMKDSIEKSQYAVFQPITYAIDALYENLSQLLLGEITQEEAITRIDKENIHPTLKNEVPIIGKASETFSLIETGNFVTDVLRQEMKTDIALFLDNGKDGTCNAKGISAKIYQGDILETDITKRVLPVLQHGEAGNIHIITMKGENLIKALEYGLEDSNSFYYFSGLKVNYDVKAEKGNRVKEITNFDGKAIEQNKLYSVAILEGSVEEEFIESTENTEILVKECIMNEIKKQGTIKPSMDNRFTYE